MLKTFGTEEYGSNTFSIRCEKCGSTTNTSLVPVSMIENGITEKMLLEARCTCGNRFGATIYIKQED